MVWKKMKIKSKMEIVNYIMLIVEIVCILVRLNIILLILGSFSNKFVIVNLYFIDIRDIWGMGEVLWGFLL